MKNHDYDEDEKEVLSEYESGALQSDPNFAERKEELQEAARNTQNKTRNINIRLTERDLSRLKAKAVAEGIPYQTLVTSILHKAASSYPADAPDRVQMPPWVATLNPFTSYSSERKENSSE